MRKPQFVLATLAIAALAAAAGAAAATEAVRDQRADTAVLKRKPELDIRRVSVADQSGDLLKYVVSVQGRLRPQRRFTRPFILINTRGGETSRSPEYMVFGPRVFKRDGDSFEKVGANRLTTRRKTWIYRFKPSRIGLGPGDTFGWSALIRKGKAVDLAPNARYIEHKIKPPAASVPRP